jgi:crotonobetainyl-CoA:carnitine CoA-transferase CaiB-like acyl-CoA transferase
VQALDNVTVLDLTHHIAGPYATRLLADFGANVVKIEQPGGDLARKLGPFQGDETNPERSGLFFYLNCNKRSVVLDLKTPAGRDALTALARKADVAVESHAPGELDRMGVGWEFLHAANPAMPLISLSNFGQTGPYRDYRLTELTLYGFAGEMYTMGETDREPVKMAGTAALIESGSATLVATMAALTSAKRHGISQHVDVALAETQMGGVDRRHATAIGYQFSGRRSLRVASAANGMPGGIYPCADGYVEFAAAGIRYDRILDMLGTPEWALEPRYTDSLQRLQPHVIEEWNVHFLGWCLERTKREVWAEARRAKVLCGPLFTTQELFQDEHFRGRGFWTEVEHPLMGEVTIPGRPFIMEKGGWELRRPAPLLGQHTEEVLKEVGVPQETISAVLEAGAMR